MSAFRTLDGLDVSGKRTLVRVDLNVPMKDGEVSDDTRIRAVLPTISELSEKGAKVILLAHFGRPGGEVKPALSLEPIARAVSERLGKPVAFAADCVGPVAADAVEAMNAGDVLLLENTRFHKGEEADDTLFTAQLATLGDIFVNDAFATAHRAHATTSGLANHMPAHAGRCMQGEIEALEKALGSPERPVLAIVGGAKVSTKIDLLENLAQKVDMLVIGGAMANTFLAARGHDLGKSLMERDLVDTAMRIDAAASAANCEILLPLDLVVAKEFAANAQNRATDLDGVDEDEMALDIGPRTVEDLRARLDNVRTVVWNGPFGAFEMKPFDAGTNAVAEAVAQATRERGLTSVAGGGDTVAALNNAGVSDDFTYISTAGGAFLEWLEGKSLPGVEILRA
ncbi:phosphoglycerate kinase [Tepidamorphus sp. 3E244]|uniref:phosphoglycerate kinase n=1 Tax=Tepidamorphus sp. 3E244 TaxID=3385498 RepID=UPI0038FCBA90